MNNTLSQLSKAFVALALGVFSLTPLFAQGNPLVDGQSTEGKDFWLTFLRADALDGDDKSITLSLIISAQEDCEVTIANPYSGYTQAVPVIANEIKEVVLYTGTAKVASRQNDKVVCYSFFNEVVDTSAVHVTSTANISLFASNFKSKSFDATNILPTASLLDDYMIQTYPPTDHGGSPQGSHFAIVATEDNTVVDYVPTAYTEKVQAGINEYGRVQQQMQNYKNFS